MIPIMSDFHDRLSLLPFGEVELEAGSILFKRDDPPRSLFIVDRGMVHLVRHQLNGSPAVMQRAAAGTILAEASMFADHYHCDAVAVTAASLRRIDMAKVRAALAGEPGFAAACAQHMAHEVQRTRMRAEILAQKGLAARLDAWLSLNTMPPRGQWSALADEIGVSREALYRELAARRLPRLTR